MAANVCHKKVLDDCGRFVWNVAEYNGHIYKPYKGDLVQRLERYKKWFPVYDGDIYLPAYSKSGELSMTSLEVKHDKSGKAGSW